MRRKRFLTVDSSDEELILLYQQGDVEAFNTLYRRYSGRVYSYLRKRLPQAEEVDEVFQLVFSKLHTSRHTYQKKYLFSQWLFVVCKTVLIDYRKKMGRSLETPEENLDHVSQTAIEAPYSQMKEAPSLSVLSEEQRKVVELRVLDELSYAEIAKLISRSEDNVRQILSRALKKLRLEPSLSGSRK